MEQKKMTIYSEEQTLTHPLSILHPIAVNPLNQLIKNEGGKGLFTSEKALDLDKVETIQQTGKGSRCCTMDFCIGLTSKEMLLVECKYNIRKPQNIGAKELKDKVQYSQELLGKETRIAREKVFLFEEKKVPEARRWIASLFANKSNMKAKVYSTREFKDTYFEK